MDPISFRAKLLVDNPRMKAVMDAAVAKAGWTPGVGSTGQGFGIALAFADETFVAEVAQVSVDTTSGQIRVKHVDVATDCGLVVNPQAAAYQTEGAVILALSPTLREAITFDNGKVTNASFGQYRPITILETPSVDAIFVEDKTQPMAGIGEPAVAPITGAVANAVYDAIGVRLREVPFTPDVVLAAIAAKGA
jgi:CO/xanthine dehydrogenase Mo-binding subunit